MADMPRYEYREQVQALRITEIEQTKLSFADGAEPVVVHATVFHRYRPVPGDYYVERADGSILLVPEKDFQRDYHAL